VIGGLGRSRERHGTKVGKDADHFTPKGGAGRGKGRGLEEEGGGWRRGRAEL